MDKVKKWMKSRKEHYLESYGSAEVAVQRMVTDANVDCGTEVKEQELSEMAREVLAKELAEESKEAIQ